MPCLPPRHAHTVCAPGTHAWAPPAPEVLAPPPAPVVVAELLAPEPLAPLLHAARPTPINATRSPALPVAMKTRRPQLPRVVHGWFTGPRADGRGVSFYHEDRPVPRAPPRHRQHPAGRRRGQ